MSLHRMLSTDIQQFHRNAYRQQTLDHPHGGPYYRSISPWLNNLLGCCHYVSRISDKWFFPIAYNIIYNEHLLALVESKLAYRIIWPSDLCQTFGARFRVPRVRPDEPETSFSIV